MAAELLINIRASNNASVAIKGVGSDLRGLESTAQSALGGVERRLDDLGDGMKRVGGNLSTYVSAPLLALGGVATKFAVDFNREMANVASLGLLPERVGELKSNVQEMAVEFGQSTKDLSQGLYQVVSAFGDSSESATLLEINAKAAAAGLATVTDSVNLTSAVTKGYGDTSEEAVRKVSDLAFQTVKLGQTTFPELAASMGKVVPLAATLGVETEELFGQMATLTGVTGNAAEVSTQLRATYQAMLKPTGEMSAAFGVVAGHLDSQGKLAGGHLVDAWRAASEQVQSSNLDLNRLHDQLRGVNLSSEEGEKAAKKLEAAIKQQEQVVKENMAAVQESAAALGGAIVESVGFTEAVSLLSAEAEGNTDTLGKMFGSVESLNAVLALSGPQAETFRSKLDAMRNATGATEEAFRAQTEGINKAGFTMQQVQAQVEVLFQRLSDGLAPALYDVLEAVKPLIDRAIDMASRFASMDKEQQRLILTIGAVVVAIGPALTILGTLAGSLSTIIGVAGSLGAALTGAGGLTAALAVLAGPVGIGLAVAAVGGLAIAWANDWGGMRMETATKAAMIADAVARMGSGMVAGLSGAMGSASSAWSSGWAAMNSHLGSAASTIGAGVGNLGNGVAAGLSGAMASASSAWSTAWRNMAAILGSEGRSITSRARETGDDAGRSLTSGLENNRSWFRSALSGMAGMVRGVFDERKNDWITSGRDIAYGISAGVSNQASGLYGAVRNLGLSMLGSFRSALGIRSPSTEFMEAGYYIAAGLAAGIDSGQGLVRASLSALQSHTALALTQYRSFVDSQLAATIAANNAAVQAAQAQLAAAQAITAEQQAKAKAALDAALAAQEAAKKAIIQVPTFDPTTLPPQHQELQKQLLNEKWGFVSSLGLSVQDVAGETIHDTQAVGIADKLRDALMGVSGALSGSVSAADIVKSAPGLESTLNWLRQVNLNGQIGAGMAALPLALREKLGGIVEKLQGAVAAAQEKMIAGGLEQYWKQAAGNGSSTDSVLGRLRDFVARTLGQSAGADINQQLNYSQSDALSRLSSTLSGAAVFGLDALGLTQSGVAAAARSLFNASGESQTKDIFDALKTLIDYRNLNEQYTQRNTGGWNSSFGQTIRQGNTFNVTFAGTFANDRAGVLQDIAFLNALYGGT